MRSGCSLAPVTLPEVMRGAVAGFSFAPALDSTATGETTARLYHAEFIRSRLLGQSRSNQPERIAVGQPLDR